MNSWIFSLVLVAFTLVSTSGLDAAPKSEKKPTPQKNEAQRNAASTPNSPAKPGANAPGTRSVPDSETESESDWEPAPAPSEDE